MQLVSQTWIQSTAKSKMQVYKKKAEINAQLSRVLTEKLTAIKTVKQFLTHCIT